ncbi:hypothetical protein [Clostridium thermobutyricum]|uniref:hypothetical protein n=1 Tax=Clostridium thermobutyricum TaxID=29372 RepID=UPI0029430F08|nr:hypothetical protein [Clostridium thermobutyricum]
MSIFSYAKITFTEKTKDIRDILLKEKEINKIKYTDFMCDAIRFFVKYKDKKNDIERALEFYYKYKDIDIENLISHNNDKSNNTFDLSLLETIIDKKLEDKLKEFNNKEENKNEDKSLKRLEQTIDSRFLEED